MYTKRQTVWLVSMLSLMVVLSAYYLFTEDTNTMNHNTAPVTLNEVKVDAQELTKQAAGQAAKEASAQGKTDAKSTAASGTAKTQTDAAARTNAAAAAGSGDGEVLKNMAAQAASGSNFFDSMQMKRNEELSRQTEKWMTVATDSKQKTENVGKAYEELDKLQEIQAKVTSIEEKLMRDFPNAIVALDDSKYKVIVQADKLEKSQAVSIVDMVMKEMSIGPERISVQYVR